MRQYLYYSVGCALDWQGASSNFHEAYNFVIRVIELIKEKVIGHQELILSMDNSTFESSLYKGHQQMRSFLTSYP